MLIRLYNGQRYLPAILPSMDEVSGPDNTLFYNYANGNVEKSGRKLPEYSLNEPILLDDIQLDIDFKRGYRDWLEKDVYSTSSEDEEEEDKVDQFREENDTPIGTPIPNATPQPISAEKLTEEINKLYIEELCKEFNEKEEKQEKKPEEIIDGWDEPINTNMNAWGMPVESNNNTEFDHDEVEPEFNPLQGINWENMTEDDLTRRLEAVESKTVQRWMNVDMNDPRYIKVLNTFEDEIPQDEEGWPIW